MLLAAEGSNSIPHLLIVFIMGTILVCGLRVWSDIVQRLHRGEAIVPATVRRPVPWGLLDIFVAIMLWMLLLLVLLTIGERWFGVPRMTKTNAQEVLMPMLLIDSLAKILASVGMLLLIRLRTRCSWGDLGLSLATIRSDLQLGLFAFLALAIPTYLVQVILVQIWPSKHPLVEMLEHDNNHRVLLTALFMAVGCAPFVEEFFFRVLFQGWLEKLFDPVASNQPHFGDSIAWGKRVETEPLELAEAEIPVTKIAVAPAALALPEASVYEDSVTPHTLAWTPIVISSLVFALMHFSHGPDWVALLILAAGLGYMYQRTHRLLPSLTVHFLLNGTSMLMLILGMLGQRK
jgi:membrane protease YdiL (CAAX protease family)